MAAIRGSRPCLLKPLEPPRSYSEHIILILLFGLSVIGTMGEKKWFVLPGGNSGLMTQIARCYRVRMDEVRGK